ncbi:MAG: hypothetical protein IH957_06250 [Chloroflexi bacterium]|nr:hypothetical protein [Chloroflexota bacterium]
MNERRFRGLSGMVGGERRRFVPILVALLALAAIAALAACGGGGDEEEPKATTPAVETAAPDGSTPTADTTLPEITSLCDLVTPKDVEEALGESVISSSEFKDVSCGYSTASGGLNIERGSQEDFEVGIARGGDLGDPVPGIGDQAAWFGFSDFGSDTLAVGKGDFYFQLRMNLPELDSATQLEMAKELAVKAVERIP